MNQFKTIVLLISTFCITIVLAQVDTTALTIDRIFKKSEFRSQRFPSSKWLMKTDNYTSLEKCDSIDGSKDIVQHNAKTGEQSVLVPAEKLIPTGAEKPLSVYSYSWSDNGEYLLIFTNTKRVWRRHTKGDYWVLNLENNRLWQLGKDLKESSLMFTKFSPDTKKAAYVSEHNLYVEDLSSGEITQLTNDGSLTIINGTFDWVYEEELGLRDGFRWSPDGEEIAFWQLDASGVGVYYMLNTTDSIYSEVIPVQYPKVGTTNSSARIGVLDLDDNEITWMNIPGDKRNNYLARMDWAANSEEIYVEQLNRKQNRNTVYLCDAESGDVRTILIEQDSAWVDINDDLKWVDDGDEFTWVSERSGWRHVYLVSRDGKEIKPITHGDFDVVSILKIDTDGGWIYFYASPDNAGQRFLYRVELKENGTMERLTPKSLAGNSRYQISNNSRWAFHSYSSFNNPTKVDLVSLPDHKVVKKLVENKKLYEKMITLNLGETGFFQIKGENGLLYDGWQMLPPDFDENKKYPVLFYVYGEPAGQTVMDRFGRSFFWYQMLAQKGYVIMSVDPRGTPAPRGREWRKSAYKKIGIISSLDFNEAITAISKKWDWVDSDRLAIWGWSGGGSSTLNMMFRYPKLLKTGMSVAPVSSEKLYDTIYQERYMGLIDENPEVYEEGSPVNYAHQLEGNLLVVHGTGDDNVHYQNTELLINELIKHNKPFTMMAYPNRSHGIREGKNTSLHLYNLLTRYLYENLEAGPQDK